MELARRIKQEENETLFLSPKTMEKQAIVQKFQLHALERQNRRLKFALALLSILLAGVVIASGYLYHRLQLSSRVPDPPGKEAMAFQENSDTVPERSLFGKINGESQIARPEIPDQSKGSSSATASRNDVRPVISAEDKEQGQHIQPRDPGDSGHNPVAAVSPPADFLYAQPNSAAQVAAEKESIIKYVGSKTSNKYHFPDCKWVKQILPERLLTFSSVDEARKTNPVACPTCTPPLADSPESN